MKKILFTAAFLAVFAACDPQATPTVQTSPTLQKATRFAADVLDSYYLWSAEVQPALSRLDPDTCTAPAAVVKEVRYHRNGREIDHWTELTDDVSSLRDYVQGLGMTFGYELAYGKITGQEGHYFLLVSAVYPDAPAGKAGLRRGDIIVSLDGHPVTADNMQAAFLSASVTLGVTQAAIDPSTGTYVLGKEVRSVSLTAENRYLNPILAETTFDIDGKRVGYLCYNAFDLNSATALPDVFRRFKDEGVRELVLDLRYNGGGYAFTEGVLASLIAPKAAVDAGAVFQTELFNDYLSAAWERQGYDTNTYFSYTHTLKGDGTDISVDISDAKPELEKVYAIVTGGTASASEGLIVGLAPYLPVVLVGQQTYGKYCAGFILSPADFYNEQYDFSLIRKWGIYVMVSMFADVNGKNAAMPDGIVPEIAATDDAFDCIQLGDENEKMLKAALLAAGKTYAAPSAVRPEGPETRLLDHGPARGLLVKTLPL